MLVKSLMSSVRVRFKCSERRRHVGMSLLMVLPGGCLLKVRSEASGVDAESAQVRRDQPPVFRTSSVPLVWPALTSDWGLRSLSLRNLADRDDPRSNAARPCPWERAPTPPSPSGTEGLASATTDFQGKSDQSLVNQLCRFFRAKIAIAPLRRKRSQMIAAEITPRNSPPTHASLHATPSSAPMTPAPLPSPLLDRQSDFGQARTSAQSPAPHQRLSRFSSLKQQSTFTSQYREQSAPADKRRAQSNSSTKGGLQRQNTLLTKDMFTVSL